MCENGKRWLNVSGVLRYLGFSRNGYNSWKNRVPSNKEQRKNKICDIYEESHQNYGAPKITAILNKNRQIISEKTVGNYMREMRLKAQWIKPYAITTIDSDFSEEYKIYYSLILILQMLYGVQILHIWTFDGFVYLTSVMDLYARKIIA